MAKKNRTKTGVAIAAVCTAIAAFGGYEIYVSNTVLEVEHITAEVKGLPPEFAGYKIAHISDMHGYTFGKNNAKIGEILKKEKPDIIVITGDIIDSTKDFKMISGTARMFAEIAPTYYVPGNHEYALKIPGEIFKELSDAGVVVLRNKYVSLKRDGAEVVLLGIDDPGGPRDMISVERAVELVRERTAAPIIMLYHRNDRAERIEKMDVGLVLFGHAHGGLIRLPFTDGLVGSGFVMLPEYTSGKYEIGDLVLIASRGLGNVGFTFRMFNKPHIPIVELAVK